MTGVARTLLLVGCTVLALAWVSAAARTISLARLVKNVQLTDEQKIQFGPSRNDAARLFFSKPMPKTPPRRRNLFYADLRSSTFEMDDKVFAWSLAPEIRRYNDFGCVRDMTVRITPRKSTKRIRFKFTFYKPWRFTFDISAAKGSKAAAAGDVGVTCYNRDLFYAWTRKKTGVRVAKSYVRVVKNVVYVKMERRRKLTTLSNMSRFRVRRLLKGTFDGSPMELAINHAGHSAFAGLEYVERRGAGLCIVQIFMD